MCLCNRHVQEMYTHDVYMYTMYIDLTTSISPIRESSSKCCLLNWNDVFTTN